MSFLTRISPEHQFALIRFTGSVFGKDITDAIESVLLDPQWRPTFVTLHDLRDIDELVLIPEDVLHFERVIRLLAPLIGPSRTAVVSRRELVQMAASLYAEQAMEIIVDHEIGLFRRLPEAVEWLGLSLEDVSLAATGIADGEL